MPFLILSVAIISAFFCLGVKFRQADPGKREWARIKRIINHSLRVGAMLPVLIVLSSPTLQSRQDFLTILAMGLMISLYFAVGIILGYLSPPRWFKWIDLL